MHKQMLKQKKGDIELSLNTILGIILAVIAILAILSIVAVIISIFYDSEKEEGTQKGFIELLSAVESLRGNDNDTKSIYIGSSYAIVGFNKNEGNVSGDCGKPTLPYTYTLSISRDLMKCPKDFSCLCLCKADHIGGIIPPILSTLTKFDYIDCQNAVCRHFREKPEIYFANTDKCNMPLLFSDGIANVEIKKEMDGKITFTRIK